MLYPSKSEWGHYPAEIAAQAVTAMIIATMSVSEISYRYFEMPARKILRSRFTRWASKTRAPAKHIVATAPIYPR